MTILHSSPLRRPVERLRGLSYWILFAIALYVPFEEFFLRWLPFPLPVVLRFVPELILYGLMVFVCTVRLSRGYPLRKTPIDWLVAAFFIATAVSIVLNGSPLLGSIINLRTIWRYLSVFYITVNLDISRSALKQMLTGLKVVMIVQGVIGSIQYFLPASFNQAFFAPVEFEIGDYEGGSLAAEGNLKVGATAGTFGDSAVLSAFLLISLSLFLASVCAVGSGLVPGWVESGGIGTALFGIFASKKRAALAIAFVMPLIVLYIYGRRKNLVYTGWLYGAAALLGFVAIVAIGASPSASVDDRQQSVDLGGYFLQVFSADYWQQSNETARGWFASTILNAIFSTHSWFGFGPDFDHTQDAIRATLNNSVEMAKLERDEGVFDDSFWFAFVAYFGIVGTFIYGFILKRLYDAAKWLARVSSEPEYRTLGTTFATLIVVTVLYTFVERIFRLRAFSFYFWLLAGLTINMCHVKMEEIRLAKSDYTGPLSTDSSSIAIASDRPLL